MDKRAFIGIDPSMNSTGISIEYDDIIEHHIICRTKKSFNMFSEIPNCIPYLPDNKIINKSYFNKILFVNSILEDIVIKKLILKDIHDIYVGIEGYSYNSESRRIFEIGELCGILKYSIFKCAFVTDLTIFPPTIVKLFGADNGQSSKGDLVLEFCEKFPKFYSYRYRDELKDLVDSYYILKLTKIKYDLDEGNRISENINDKIIKFLKKEIRVYGINGK